MPGPGTSSFIGPTPGHFLLCKSPGAGHTFRCKSRGVPGGMVTGQIDTCKTSARNKIKSQNLGFEKLYDRSFTYEIRQVTLCTGTETYRTTFLEQKVTPIMEKES